MQSITIPPAKSNQTGAERYLIVYEEHDARKKSPDSDWTVRAAFMGKCEGRLITLWVTKSIFNARYNTLIYKTSSIDRICKYAKSIADLQNIHIGFSDSIFSLTRQIG